jgi:hypothetical protein
MSKCNCLEKLHAALQEIVDFNQKDLRVSHDRYASVADVLSAIEIAIATPADGEGK